MSGVNYYVRLSDEPSDDDQPRMTATRAMVAALTCVDMEHQGQRLSSGFSFGGHGPRWWSCRVEGPQVKREWRDVAEFLVRARLIDKYTWYGEMEEEDSMRLVSLTIKQLLFHGIDLSQVISVWNDVVEGKE